MILVPRALLRDLWRRKRSAFSQAQQDRLERESSKLRPEELLSKLIQDTEIQ